MANRVEIPIVVLSESNPTYPIANATATVKERGGSEAPVYSNSGSTEDTLEQPLSTDSAGRLDGWLERGAYEVIITVPGNSPYLEYLDISPGSDGSVDTEWLADESITGDKIDSSLVDAATGTASLRTLGTGAKQAAAGNDSRLSNERTPSNGSVSTTKIQDEAVSLPKLSSSIQTSLGISAKVSPADSGAKTPSTSFAMVGTEEKVSLAVPSDSYLQVWYEAFVQVESANLELVRAAIFLSKEGGEATQLRVPGTSELEPTEAYPRIGISSGNGLKVSSFSGGLCFHKTLSQIAWSGASQTFSPREGSYRIGFALAEEKESSTIFPGSPALIKVEPGTWEVSIRWRYKIEEPLLQKIKLSKRHLYARTLEF